MENDKYFIEMMTTDLILMVMQNMHKPMVEAFDIVYNSDTYRKVSNASTNLIYQSPKYVFSYLDNELQTGQMG